MNNKPTTHVNPHGGSFWNIAGFALMLLAVSATSLSATSNYVYHEATTNNPGCGTDNYRSVLVPAANQALTIAFKAEYSTYHDQARVYYTTDGSTPAGAFGTGSGTTQVLVGTFSCTFNSGGIVDVVTATIPGQPYGTTVKYIVSAWHSGGGDEIFGNGCGDCGSPNNSSALATVFSYTLPQVGASMNFDGVDDYVSVPDVSSLDLGASLTLEAWVKPESFSTYNIIIDKRETADASANYGLALTNGRPMFYFWNGSNLRFHIATDAIALNNFTHLAATYDGAAVRIYVNGAQVYAQAETEAMITNNQPLNIGRNPNTLQYFDGDIDEVRVWNTARTCDEISELYNCELTGNEDNLVAYYNFNQGLANEDNSSLTIYLFDSANFGGANDGILTNFALNGSTSNWTTPGGVTTGTSCSALVPVAFSVCPTGESVNTVTGTCAAPASYTATANADIAYLFTGATTGSGAGTGSGSTFNRGTTTVTLTATNACAATATCQFSVQVSDAEAPAITCPPTANLNTDNNLCTSTASIGTASATDNCTITLNNALHFDGGDDYATATVPGTFLGSNPLTIEFWAKNNSAFAFPMDFGPTWQVQFGGGTFYLSGFGLGAFNTGATVSTSGTVWEHFALTYDGAGTWKAYKNGLPTPTPSCTMAACFNNYSSILTNPPLRMGVGNNNYFYAGGLDEVRIWSVERTQSQIAANLYSELGGMETGLKAYYKFNQGTAGGNNTGITAATATTGNNAPLNNLNLNGATSNFIAGPSIQAVITNDAAAALPKGTTTVTWMATDGSGNTNSCQQTVNVTDNQIPVLTAPSNQSVNVTAGTCTGDYTIADPISDNCTGSTWSATFSGNANGNPTDLSNIADGMGSGPITFQKGTTTVVLSGADEASNAATTKTFTVTVVDNEVPTISGCSATDQNFNVVPGTCAHDYSIPGPTTLTDNCPGTLTWNATFSGNPNGNPTNLTGQTIGVASADISFTRGVTTVTLSASDISGNTSTNNCTFTVTVIDNEVPSLTCIPDVTVNTADGLCTAGALPTPTIADNCDGTYFGNALHLDGTNDVVVLDNNLKNALNGGTAITVEYWFKGTNLQSAFRFQDVSNAFLIAGHGATNPQHIISTDGNLSGVLIGNSVLDGNWHHIAMTWQKNTTNGFKSYVDGVVVAQRNSANVNLPVVAAPPTLGGYFAPGASQEYMNGALEEVRIWNVARTQAQIQAAMNSQLAGNEANLVAYYNFNQGTAGGNNAGITTLPDLATALGGTNNGTLNNFALNGATSNWVAYEGLTVSNDAPPLSQGTTTTVTWTVSDDAGNSSTCQQNVTVEDNELPVLTVPAANVNVNVTPGACTGDYTIADPIFDNCTGSTWSATFSGNALGNPTDISNIADGTDSGPITFQKGTTTVILSGTDAVSNAATTVSFTVTVVDNEVPTISGCSATDQNFNVVPGTCAHDYSIPGPTTLTDNCPGTLTWNATFSGNPNGNPTNLTGQTIGVASADISFTRGVTTVTLSASDISGNTSTNNCTFTVTVIDDEVPSITCAADVTINTTTGLCTGTTTLVAPTVSDNCTGSGSPTNNAPAAYAKGSNTVTWTVADASGNTSTCAQTVTVEDNELPVLTIPAANVNVNVTPGTCTGDYTIADPIFDNCTGSTWSATFSGNALGNPTDISNIADGTGSGPITFQKGATTVVLSGVDAVSNAASTVSFTVTVVDNEVPTISGCSATDQNFNVVPGTCAHDYSIPGPTTLTDNCPGTLTWNATFSGNLNGNPTNLTGQTIGVASGNIAFTRGITTVTLSASDISGNTSTANCTFTVTVIDDEVPSITCAADVTINTTTGLCTGTTTLIAPTVTDNCTGNGSPTNNAPATYAKGSNTVTWTVADASGNTSTCAQTVTVVDNQAPTLTAPSNQTLSTAAGVCTQTYTIADPISDNCTGSTWSATFSGNANGNPTDLSNIADGTGSGAVTFQKGTTTVTLSGVDAVSNAAATVMFTVTVTDDEVPTISGCATNQSFNIVPGTCAAPYSIPAPTTLADNCPGPLTWSAAFSGNSNGNPTNLTAQTDGAASGDISFARGVTTVTLSATDISGNTSTANCSFTVTVIDDEVPSITCAADVTINTTTGLCTGTTTLTDPTVTDNCPLNFGTGNGLDFDGSNDHVEVAHTSALSISTQITLEAWIYPRVVSGERSVLIKGTSDACQNYGLFVRGGKLAFVSSAQCGWSGEGSNATITANTWQHVAATVSGGTLKLYVNGILKNTISGINIGATNAGVLWLGKSNLNPFSGAMDDVRIWNVARTDAEILANMNSELVGNETGLVEYLKFNQGAAGGTNTGLTTATATTGTSGTLNGFALTGATSNWVSGAVTGTPPVNNAPATYPKGTTTVTWTVADASGNTSTCAQTVTVVDNELPVLTAPSNQTLSTAAGVCTQTYTIADPISDNCTGSTWSATFSGNANGNPTDLSNIADGTGSGAVIFQKGTTTVTLSGVDAVSNAATTVMFTVTVTDDEVPTISGCATNQSFNIVPGTCAAPYSIPAPTTLADNCPGPLTWSAAFSGNSNGNPTNLTAQTDGVASGDISFTRGITTVTLSATDVSGNTSTNNCSFTVTVIDNEVPSITCAADVTINTTTGLCTGTTTLIAPTVTDNCTGNGSPTNNAPATYAKGSNTVTWTVADASGNTSTCAQTVTVVDNELPVLTAPSNQNLSAAAGVCTQIYTIADPISDNCTGSTWTYELSGATVFGPFSVNDGVNSPDLTFNLGVTTVTLNGMDAASHAAVQKTFTVTVADNIVPTVNACFGTNIAAFGQATGNSTTTAANSVYQSFTAPQTGVITSIQVQVGGASGLTLQVGNGTSCGGTVLGSKVFNSVGGLQTITFDTPIPVTGGVQYNFGILGNHTAGWATTGSYPGGQMYYNGCPGSPAFPNSDLVFTINMNYVPPISLYVVPGTCAQNYSIPAPTISDNCTGPLTWNATFSGNSNGNPSNLTGLADGSPTSALSFSKGVTQVVLNAVDVAGNISTTACPFTVTVIDDEVPGITCASDVTINTTTGLCTGTTTLTNPTVTDNCPLTLVGNALNFDGTNDYVTIPNESSFDFTNAMTVEVWAKLNPSSTNLLTLISKGDDSWRLHRFANQNKIQFGTSGLSNTDLSSGTSVSDGNWHHIAAVFTGTQKLIYIDGNLDASTTVTGTIGNSAYQVAFGENLQATGRYYNGSLDEVRIWSTARTQAQIQANMNLELSTGAGLVAAYHFNQGIAAGSNAGVTSATDASGNNLNGTLNNFALSGATSNWVAGLPFGLSNNAPATYAKGSNTVTWTITDASSNTASCAQMVTVVDNELPVLTAPSNQTLSAAAGVCSQTYIIADPISDNCTGSTWSASFSGNANGNPTDLSNIADGTGSGAVTFQKGTTTVVLSGVDAASNAAATVMFTVTVNDNERPTISGCATNETLSTATGTCAQDYSIPAPTLADNCTDNLTWNAVFSGNSNGNPTNLTAQANGVASANVSFQKGTTTVTLSATDAVGNTSTVTCSFTVTVNDDEEPDITCADDVTINTTTGLCTGTTTLTNPAVSDNCTGIGTPTNNAPATYAKGSNTVTWTVADASGNTSTCAQMVTVVDNELPVLTAPSNQTLSTAAGACSQTYTIADPISDNCTGSTWSASFSGNTNGNPTDISNIADGTGSGAVTFQKGTTTVTLSGVDAASNAAATVMFTVTVTDDERPTISGCATNQTLSTATGTCAQDYSIPAPTLADNCTDNLTWSAVFSGNSNGNPTGLTAQADGAASADVPFQKGTTLVTLSATDAVGNTSTVTCSFTVTVNDDEEPGITCADDVTINTTTGLCTGTTTLINPAVSDNCTGIGTPTNNAPTTYAKGSNTVTWVATDASGNTASCAQMVTVVDNELPTTTGCPLSQNLFTKINSCTQDYSVPAPTISDNCTGPFIWHATFSGNTNGNPTDLTGQTDGVASGNISFQKGTTTVTLSSTDVSGNVSTANCSFTVTVTDNVPPVVPTLSQINAICASTPTAPTTTDNCAGTVTGTTGTTFPITALGITTITWTFDDGNGNTSTATQTVSLVCDTDQDGYNPPEDCDDSNPDINPGILEDCGLVGVMGVDDDCDGTTDEDLTDPVAVCQPLAVALNAAGMVVLGDSDLDNGSSDNCVASGNLTFATSPNSFDCDDAGPNTVTLTVSDPSGNSSACTAVVTVVDVLNYAETPGIRTASDGLASDKFGWGLGFDGGVMIVGAPDDKIGTQNKRGSAYVFLQNLPSADLWGQLKQLKSSDGIAVDYFGNAISVHGSTAVIGSHGSNVGALTDAGSVYVFEQNHPTLNNWGERKRISAPDAAAYAYFGNAVSLLGERAVIGASKHKEGSNSAQGAAYIFEKNTGGANNWGNVKKLIAADGAPNNFFGNSVTQISDLVLVGANGNSNNRGAAYLFGKNTGGSGNWGQAQKLTASDAAVGDGFGASVSMTSDYVLIGAPNKATYSGAAYIFKNNAGTWSQLKKITVADGAINDRLGTSVEVEGDYAYISAVRASGNAGAVYVFHKNVGGPDNWGQIGKYTATNGASGDQIGYSLGVSGEMLVFGANLDDIAAKADQGSVYVFRGEDCGEMSKPSNTLVSVADQSGLSPNVQCTPNPFTDELAIMVSAFGATHLTVTDAAGRLMAEADLPAGNVRFDLKTNEFRAGIYFVQVSSEAGVRVVPVALVR